MNAGLIVGFLLSCGIIAYLGGTGAASIFMNLHAFIAVGLGTIAVLLMMTPARDMRVFLSRVIGLFGASDGTSVRIAECANAIRSGGISGDSRQDPAGLTRRTLRLLDMGLSPDDIADDLDDAALERLEPFVVVTRVLRNLAKYPPALGMAGTVLGLLDLFRNLGPESRGGIGAGLAVAMTATFFGLALANLVLLPLADRCESLRAREDTALRALISALVHQVRLMAPASGADLGASDERGVSRAA